MGSVGGGPRVNPTTLGPESPSNTKLGARFPGLPVGVRSQALPRPEEQPRSHAHTSRLYCTGFFCVLIHRKPWLSSPRHLKLSAPLDPPPSAQNDTGFPPAHSLQSQRIR